MNEDTVTLQSFEKKYPGKIMQLSYDRFSSDPLENSKKLFEFAFDSKILSKTTLDYIEIHTKTDSIYNTMSTVKKTDKVYQAWRTNISDTLLQEIESQSSCRESIQTMGHTIFQSFSNAKDMSIPLFAPSN